MHYIDTTVEVPSCETNSVMADLENPSAELKGGSQHRTDSTPTHVDIKRPHIPPNPKKQVQQAGNHNPKYAYQIGENETVSSNTEVTNPGRKKNKNVHPGSSAAGMKSHPIRNATYDNDAPRHCNNLDRKSPTQSDDSSEDDFYTSPGAHVNLPPQFNPSDYLVIDSDDENVAVLLNRR